MSAGLSFLMNGEPELVKNFLLMAVQLQGTEKRVDCFTLGEGVMPASFKVLLQRMPRYSSQHRSFPRVAIVCQI